MTNCLAKTDQLQVFVSILPQKYFVQRIAGDTVKVEVMVGPGQSPETYEPSPKQLVKLSAADVYFSIGVPFEKAWMSRLSSVNHDLEIVDVSAPATNFYDDQAIEDPHIWVSPVLAKLIAEQIMETLIRIDHGNASIYRANYYAFAEELDNLDKEIRKMLGDWVGKGVFLVMHPAWGYFAKTYGLEQIAIEYEGKSPGAKSLQSLIRRAKEEKINTVFVQEQHSSRLAKTVASALGAKIVRLDPLAGNYIENLRKVAAALADSFTR